MPKRKPSVPKRRAVKAKPREPQRAVVEAPEDASGADHMLIDDASNFFFSKAELDEIVSEAPSPLPGPQFSKRSGQVKNDAAERLATRGIRGAARLDRGGEPEVLRDDAGRTSGVRPARGDRGEEAGAPPAARGRNPKVEKAVDRMTSRDKPSKESSAEPAGAPDDDFTSPRWKAAQIERLRRECGLPPEAGEELMAAVTQRAAKAPDDDLTPAQWKMAAEGIRALLEQLKAEYGLPPDATSDDLMVAVCRGAK